MPLAYDDVTNDLPALQALIDAAPAHTEVVLDAGRSCRLVVDGSVPERGLVGKPGVRLNLNGTLLRYECHGDVYCTRPTDGFEVVKGRVYLTASDGLTSQQACYHAPISMGSAYGEILSLTSRGPYIEAKDWGFHDLEIYSMKPANGWAICGLGGFQGGKISDIKVLDSPTLWGGIDFDWGTLGMPGTIAQNRANFGTGHGVNGSFRGIHPKTIWMDRIRIGRLTNPLSEAIRMSGCDAFSISKVFVEYCGASGFSHYAGDQGHEFCGYGPNRYQAYMNTTVRDYTVSAVGPTGNALRLDSYADNLDPSREPNYSPLSPIIWPTNILIDGFVADGAGGVGVKIGPMAGGTIRRARINWFHCGVDFPAAGKISRFTIEDSVIHGQDASAIKYSAAGVPISGAPTGATENRVYFET